MEKKPGERRKLERVTKNLRRRGMRRKSCEEEGKRTSNRERHRKEEVRHEFIHKMERKKMCSSKPSLLSFMG